MTGCYHPSPRIFILTQADCLCFVCSKIRATIWLRPPSIGCGPMFFIIRSRVASASSSVCTLTTMRMLIQTSLISTPGYITSGVWLIPMSVTMFNSSEHWNLLRVQIVSTYACVTLDQERQIPQLAANDGVFLITMVTSYSVAICSICGSDNINTIAPIDLWHTSIPQVYNKGSDTPLRGMLTVRVACLHTVNWGGIIIFIWKVLSSHAVGAWSLPRPRNIFMCIRVFTGLRCNLFFLRACKSLLVV